MGRELRHATKALAAIFLLIGMWLCLRALDAAQAAAQQPPAAGEEVPTLKVAIHVVNVYAVVREKNRRLISDLSRDDFQLFENKVPQDIKYFSRATDTPLTLGIMVDVSPSQERVLGIEQQEAKAFLRQVMRPRDLAFVLHFYYEVELLQDFTADQSRLARAIDETVIRAPASGPLPPTVPAPPLGGTHLLDAVYLAARELMRGQVGRKVLILLSDGVDQGSEVKLDQAREAAQKADVIIYSVDVSDPSFYWRHGGGFRGRSVLKELSRETGGRVIEARRPEKMALAFQQIAQELRTQYLLGYSSTNTKADGSFRKIEVKIRGRKYKVQARRGYYAPSE